MNSDRDFDRHFLMPKQRLSPVLSCPVKKKNIREHIVYHEIGAFLKWLFTVLITETSLQEQPGVYAQENKGDHGCKFK